MNKIFFTIIIFTSVFSIGQTNTANKPQKKAWKILIKNSNDKEKNFKLIGQTIIDNDFSIEKKDNDYLTFETTPKVTDGKTSTFFLKFVAKDNLIILTGMAKSRINTNFYGIEEEYLKISNVGMKGSISKDQFDTMLNFSKLFTNSEFEFISE